MLSNGDHVRTPDGWMGRVEAVLPVDGMATVVHPDTGLAWWFLIDDLDLEGEQ